MRSVVDTNVFVSSFFGGNPRRIVDLWKEQRITLCLSREIVDEYVEVLHRIGLEGEEEVKELLSLFSRDFNLLFTAKTPERIVVKGNPGDDKFLECAVALNADVIITGERPLKAVGEYLGILIFSPAEFLEHLSGQRP